MDFISEIINSTPHSSYNVLIGFFVKIYQKKESKSWFVW